MSLVTSVRRGSCLNTTCSRIGRDLAEGNVSVVKVNKDGQVGV